MAGEDAVSAETIVSEGSDPIDGFAAQHGDDVADAEALSDADHARQDLLRHDSGVGDLFDVAEAEIAGPAVGSGIRVAEVADQRAMTADRAARIAVHLVD